MPRYFQNMPVVGKPVRANAENVAELKAIEEEIHAQIVKGLENGKADADMNAKGQLTAMQRVSLLVDPGTWCPARLTTCCGAATPPSGCASP